MPDVNNEKELLASKHMVGRSKTAKPKPEQELKTYELSITMSANGEDVGPRPLENIQRFFVQETSTKKSFLVRGGTPFHLHL